MPGSLKQVMRKIIYQTPKTWDQVSLGPHLPKADVLWRLQVLFQPPTICSSGASWIRVNFCVFNNIQHIYFSQNAPVTPWAHANFCCSQNLQGSPQVIHWNRKNTAENIEYNEKVRKHDKIDKIPKYNNFFQKAISVPHLSQILSPVVIYWYKSEVPPPKSTWSGSNQHSNHKLKKIKKS